MADTANARWVEALHHDVTTFTFANGRSYADSCLAASGRVLQILPLERLIAANWETGIMRGEPSITLEHIFDVAIPRGWMLQVTLGSKYATPGGAIAMMFVEGHHVRAPSTGTCGALRPRAAIGTQIECAPDEQTESFAAKTGGLGLTVVIEWVGLHARLCQTDVP
jgi:FAD/FMN-containing dehydrogenase